MSGKLGRNFLLVGVAFLTDTLLMRVIYSKALFRDEVGVLSYSSLKAYGVEPDTYSGRFFTSRIWTLENLCKKHSELHIATRLGIHIFVNKFVDGGTAFFLCNGNRDEEIMAFFKMSLAQYERLKISKFDYEQ